jgi:hypothetical protein
MLTARASVAHGIGKVRAQMRSCHENKKKTESYNNERGGKKTKTDSNKSTAFGKRLLFVVNVNVSKYLNCDGRSLQKKANRRRLGPLECPLPARGMGRQKKGP